MFADRRHRVGMGVQKMVIAVDVDGTLFDGSGVADEAITALREARAEGHLLVIVTGRRWEGLEVVVPAVIALANRVVCEEGGVIVDVGTGQPRLLAEPVEPDLIAALIVAGVPALDIGHVVVEPDGRPCICGGKGCLETYCGGRAIEAETGRPPQRAPAAIVERTGVMVGRALASVGAVCDLKLAIVGGSVALGFGEPFFRAAQDELDKRARLPFTSGFQVMPATLGPRAPLIGAAALARRSHS